MRRTLAHVYENMRKGALFALIRHCPYGCGVPYRLFLFGLCQSLQLNKRHRTPHFLFIYYFKDGAKNPVAAKFCNECGERF